VLVGGGQEWGLRPGTQPTHQIVGLGLTCELAAASREAEYARISALRDRFWAALAGVEGVRINGARAPRVPHILNLTFDDVNGESLVAQLPGLMLSAGAACNSALSEPSAVLRALGCSVREAESSLRFSFGRFTTGADVDAAAAQVREALSHLRARSPARGPLPGADAVGEAGAATADTWLRCHLWVRDGRVGEARFQVRGCPYTVAVVDWLADRMAGRPLAQAVPGSPQDWAVALGAPVERLGALLQVEDALRAALAGAG
jgi:NifU-like protein involved in Fe-S cluster formation